MLQITDRAAATDRPRRQSLDATAPRIADTAESAIIAAWLAVAAARHRELLRTVAHAPRRPRRTAG